MRPLDPGRTAFPHPGAWFFGTGLVRAAVVAAGLGWAATGTAADLTFFAYSDSHYEAEHTGTRSEVNWINNLPGTAWPTEVGGVVGTPKGVIMAGDLIDDGAVSALYPTQWANWSADYGVNGEGRCKFPVFENVGNHDLNTNLFMFNKVAERNLVRKDAGLIGDISPNGYHYSWDWDGIHFVNVNLFPGNVWEGEADSYGPAHKPQNSRDFLVQDLQTQVGNSGRPVVVIQHFRPVDENWWTYSAADKYHKVIQDYNVIMIMCGHQGGGVNNIWRGINWASSNGNVEAYRISDDNKLSIAMRGSSSWGQVFQKAFYRSYATSGRAAVINNGGWATDVASTTATLSGKLLYAAVGSTAVTIHWGTSDGGTNGAAWQHSTNLGVQTPDSVFSTGISGLQPNQNYFYRCSATNSKGTAWAAASIPFTAAGTLPAGWGTRFVGYEQRPWGGANESNGAFTVVGSGRDIGEGGQPIDNFQYAYCGLDGDGEITARITSSVVTSREPKVGVMMRETLADDSRNVSLLLVKNETIRLMSRSNPGGGTSSTNNSPPTVPNWVKLSRIGNIFTGYQSLDGSSWTQVGSPVTIGMASNIFVGLAVTAGNRDGSRNHSATFDHISVTGDNLPMPPSISNVGDQVIEVNGSTGPLAFTLGDLETNPAALELTGSSSNPALVPDNRIVFGGSGANRTVTVTPLAGTTGSATITLTVDDGTLSASDTFLLTVLAGQVFVSEWQSVSDHAAAPQSLALTETPVVEPRMAGLRRLVVAFSAPVTVTNPTAAVTISGLNQAGTINLASLGISANAAASGNLLTLTFTQAGNPVALPDAAKWRFTLNPAAIGGAGGLVLSPSAATTRVVASLAGDVDGNGRVTGLDLNRIATAGAFNPGSAASLRADVNGDAAIDQADQTTAWANRARRTDTLTIP